MPVYFIFLFTQGCQRTECICRKLMESIHISDIKVNLFVVVKGVLYY